MFSPVVHGDQVSLSPEARVTIDLSTFSVTSAHIAQTDALLPTLTVRETLPYVTPLRLPSSTTSQQRKQLVEEISLELGLEECADRPVGDGLKKGGGVLVENVGELALVCKCSGTWISKGAEDQESASCWSHGTN